MLMLQIMCKLELGDITKCPVLWENCPTIAYRIVESHALNWNKLINWNEIKEYIQYQLEALDVPTIQLDYIVLLSG